MSIVRSIIFVILMLGVLATLHELGHFWVARLLKIRVFEVSIFVGPKLLSWKHNDVNFSIRLIPVGAYVRFTEVDEQGYVVESKDPDLLVNQPRFKRLLVSVAGPLVNLLLGIFIFAMLFVFTGYTTLNVNKAMKGTQLYQLSSEYTVGDEIRKINGRRVYTAYDLSFEIDAADAGEDMIVTFKSKETGKNYDLTLKPEFKKRPMLLITTRTLSTDNEYQGWLVLEVDPEQNNSNPILKEGDYVTKINGMSVADEGFEEFLYTITDDVIKVTYVRDGVSYEEDLVPRYVDYVTTRGISITDHKVDSPAEFFGAFGCAAKIPGSLINITVTGIKSIIAGKEKAYNLVSGPIGITTMVNDVVKDERDTVYEKIYTLIMLSGVISIALAYSNLLPIPGLDGIQIVLILVEMVIGRKLSEKAEGRLTVIGFVMIIALLVFAFISDILRIIFGY
ncbi:MAG: RIP metalloprotease RseP [Saccharofermentans sp.]|nr:RIP metalloprotease RseP [Saccharofermentans sp.]